MLSLSDYMDLDDLGINEDGEEIKWDLDGITTQILAHVNEDIEIILSDTEIILVAVDGRQ